MKFWKWYISWFANPRIHPLIEYLLGFVIVLFGTVFLGVLLSFWYLLFTVPVGLTMVLHGIWRQFIQLREQD